MTLYLAVWSLGDAVREGHPARILVGGGVGLAKLLYGGGQVLGQVVVELDTLTLLAVRSQIDFWDVSRFDLTVTSVDTLATFDSSIWQNSN